MGRTKDDKFKRLSKNKYKERGRGRVCEKERREWYWRLPALLTEEGARENSMERELNKAKRKLLLKANKANVI